MTLEIFLKQNKKKILATTAFILVILVAFFVTAYFSGKSVADDVNVQWVSHTEYWNNDVASTIIRLADYKGNPYAVDSCSVTILYPDKSTFIDAQPLTQSNIEGNWYRTDSLLGKPLGTYEQQVTCVKGQQTIITSQSFHLNPALQEIEVITNKSDALSEKLTNVEFNLTTVIQETNESLSLQVSATENNLNTAIDAAEAQIVSDLGDLGVNLDTTLSSINATVTTQIADVNTELNTHLDDLNASLENSLNIMTADLTSQLTAIYDNLNLLNESLFDFDVRIHGALADSEEVITTQITVTESNLNTALDAVNNEILNSVNATGIDINANLANAQATIVTRIDDLDAEFTTDLSSVNSSLNAFLTSMQSSLSSQLTTMYNDLTTQLTSIKADSSWLAANAMNQDDMAEIENRFTSVDSDLDKVLAFCSESTTNSSALCQEVYNLRHAVDNLRDEQEAQFDILNATTLTTWEFVSGSISNRIDNILIGLNIIQEQNEEINATTHEILDEIQGEIRANIIS